MLKIQGFADGDRMLKILGSKDDEMNEILFREGAKQVRAKFVFRDHALDKSFKFTTIFRVIDAVLPPLYDGAIAYDVPWTDNL